MHASCLLYQTDRLVWQANAFHVILQLHQRAAGKDMRPDLILEQCLSAVQSLLLPDYLAAGFRHSTASAHAVIPKAQHAERMTGSHHPGHTAGSPASQCTAESNACLLCKAFCCLFTLLQGFRHSRASVHAV